MRQPEAHAFLHLPVQSGSERILKAMNRGHGIDCYLKTVASARRPARHRCRVISSWVFPAKRRRILNF
jgi:tRNA A37 methylthiotransferase MiaB